MTPRLTTLDGLPKGVARPGYLPSAHGVGIVHLGLGAFHKAHQAPYTDTALAVAAGDWRIAGVSLRSPKPTLQLGPQNGLFTLIERDSKGSRARVIGAIARALCLGPDRAAVMDALTAPATRIVSLTVTEKGYGVDRSTGGIDRGHKAIAHDLLHPDAPIGVAGLLILALGLRRAAGVAPFTVLCCDNLPDNGALVRGLLVDFARHAAPDLADHIAAEVAFPATMVDRITPASTEATRAAARQMTGCLDEAAVEAESFCQWVIEDHFPTGRPAWEAAGALFVSDVRPYEEMKLRMLNGAHSMLAYAGFMAGHAHVADVMADRALARLVHRHLGAAAATLPPLPDVDLEAYAAALMGRFANPHLRHATFQIAMDGTEKLPQRILAPAVAALEAGQPIDAFAFATAAWMRYVRGMREDGTAHDLRDPREEALRAALADTPAETVRALMALPGLFPRALRDSASWTAAVTGRLERMLAQGMKAAIAEEDRAARSAEA
ncbi:mannitol dehydrogenase family protein [Rhodovulum euryhalinum]|uniref:Fructuronate reductase n=1 Tax=Rhodovulum euryhalinum TaxID=35805 RepID=A0A4R2KKY0_9RHOB|nr:mannitol dehydrogenase family protein [Rhodovulum euryhalinum]TCO71316.1 fructuronate reductase [Rhodovulum euryhalinum]